MASERLRAEEPCYVTARRSTAREERFIVTQSCGEACLRVVLVAAGYGPDVYRKTRLRKRSVLRREGNSKSSGSAQSGDAVVLHRDDCTVSYSFVKRRVFGPAQISGDVKWIMIMRKQ